METGRLESNGKSRTDWKMCFTPKSLKLAKFTSFNDYWVIVNCCAFVVKRINRKHAKTRRKLASA
jgi:hypothetical protein